MAAAAQGVRLCSIADAGPRITTVFARPDTAILARVVDMVGTGTLRVTVAASLTLADAAIAQDASKARSHGPGKVTLVSDVA